MLKISINFRRYVYNLSFFCYLLSISMLYCILSRIFLIFKSSRFCRRGLHRVNTILDPIKQTVEFLRSLTLNTKPWNTRSNTVLGLKMTITLVIFIFDKFFSIMNFCLVQFYTLID